MLKEIKSKYILEDVLSYIQKKIKMKLIEHNKNLQTKVNISLKDYKNFGKIVIELFPCELKDDKDYKFINIQDSKNEEFFHIYLNDNEKERAGKGFIGFWKNLFTDLYSITKDDKISKIKIIIDKKISSLVGLFQECICLEKINFVSFENDHITNMANMFYKCDTIKIIIYSPN